jgi:hypothetical protein
MFYLVFLSALLISGIAGFISISGLMAIFPGSPWIVALMGGALELGKLVAASWVYRYWKKAGWLRHYFVAAVCTLSLVTSVGIFGYLSKSHIEGRADDALNAGRIELVQQQIAAESTAKAVDTRTLSQIDESVSRLLSNDRISGANGAVTARTRQRAERAAVLKSIADHDQKILDLRTVRSSLAVEQTKIDADVGPIKYVAQVLFQGDDRDSVDRAVRWLTIVLMFVFDPLAILLFIAAGITKTSRLSVETSSPLPVKPDPETLQILKEAPPREKIEFPVESPFESPGVSVVERDVNLVEPEAPIRSLKHTRDILKTKQALGRT